MSLFDSMCAFALKTKIVRMAAPDDILREVPVWSPEQELLPLPARGEPLRMTLESKPGALTMDFEIRPLTMSQRGAAEKILDAAIPPATFIDEPSDRPGVPPKRIPTGYDDEHPAYLAEVRALQDRQAAFDCLKGVVGLEPTTSGETESDRTRTLMESMPTRLLKFLAVEIWSMTYAQGDPNDFFTSGDSRPSPNCEPSPSKNPAVKKPK